MYYLQSFLAGREVFSVHLLKIIFIIYHQILGGSSTEYFPEFTQDLFIR